MDKFIFFHVNVNTADFSSLRGGDCESYPDASFFMRHSTFSRVDASNAVKFWKALPQHYEPLGRKLLYDEPHRWQQLWILESFMN